LHCLPLDKVRPEVKRFEGAAVTGELPEAVAKRLLEVASEHQLTPFMLLHGALSLLLSRHSNSNDIVVGTPVANRLQVELTPLVGFFVNTLVLRADTHLDTHNNKLADYLAHIRQVHIDAQSNQDVPFEQLVERLKAPRSTAHTPLFQIMMLTDGDFNLDNGGGILNLPGVDMRVYQSDLLQEKFDLTVSLNISEQGVRLHWSYDVGLFTEQHIVQLNDHMCRLLEGLSQVQGQTATLSGLSVLSTDEINHLLYTLNDTATDYQKDLCIHQLFEQQAALNPASVAVFFENTQMSYQQLNLKSNQLAHYLRQQHQVGPDTLVGLCVERSLEMVIGIMAILKAGGAYVPLDPGYPQERLNYLFEDAALDVVLSQTHLLGLLGSFNGTLLALDGLGDRDDHFCSKYQISDPASVKSSNLAYMIYTSGSTGKPKGVMVEHQALFNRIHWMHNKYGMTADDKVLQKTPYSFDVSVWEFVWTLAYGAQLVIARPEGHKDPQYLCEVIQRQGITKLHFVPSMLGVMLDFDGFKNCHTVKQLFCSGEALQQGHVQGFRAVLPGSELHNLYGPTEAAIDVSYWDCASDISRGVPIGKPIDNIQLVILDAHLNLVPQGVVGELYIGGDGLARGYHNRAQLTAQTFIDNPFYDAVKTNSSKRWYKTGDLVRLRENGEIEYQGRTDHQVKIRGLRIELGEIEHQLGGLAQVDSALVLAQALAGSMQLIAYVKAASVKAGEAVIENGVPDIVDGMADYITSIKSELAQTLPAHMVPGILMVVDDWPLTPNGKVDRKALPATDGMALFTGAVSGECAAPQTSAELALAGIWAEVLNIKTESVSNALSTTANFFESGGHSLLAIRLVAEIRNRCGVEISLQDIFNHPTLQDM
ncbi:MAG: amino acid adenylation domain-containing protein, partial [Algicola sp.]|nr:amino acid adenylation domain-containing protein [Algicola sp.]